MVLVSTAGLLYNSEREQGATALPHLGGNPFVQVRESFLLCGQEQLAQFPPEGYRSALVGGRNEKTAIGFSRSWVVEETPMSSCLHQIQAGL